MTYLKQHADDAPKDDDDANHGSSPERALFDALGDRMKAMEAASAGKAAHPTAPYLAIRIDGRGFSKFTKAMTRPFDKALANAMLAAALATARDARAMAVYTQSDEITLILEGSAPGPDGLGRQAYFGAKTQKLASVAAGLATSAFVFELARGPLGAHLVRLPHFDARLVALDSVEDAVDMVRWRMLDARRNSVSQAASARISAGTLHGAGVKDRIRLLSEAGVTYADYPAAFRNGVLRLKQTVLRPLSAQEMARIPVQHRPEPGAPVRRSSYVDVDLDAGMDAAAEALRALLAARAAEMGPETTPDQAPDQAQ